MHQYSCSVPAIAGSVDRSTRSTWPATTGLPSWTPESGTRGSSSVYAMIHSARHGLELVALEKPSASGPSQSRNMAAARDIGSRGGGHASTRHWHSSWTRVPISAASLPDASQ